jgi:hypothetical protein
MVSFIDNEPMRPSGFGTQLCDLGQEPGEKTGTFGSIDGQKVCNHADLGLGQQGLELGNARLLLGVTHHYGVGEFRIVSLRIYHAELEGEIAHLLQQRRHDGRFAGA